ncbi:hypothetical protein [Planomicrobium soli]|uniref:hypothetical protein n=1 Tax=Planomicrobium soli TaxID=1176648 RepID=UPI0015E74572|nr:hypothetical protein [Planomicrobium soli]
MVQGQVESYRMDEKGVPTIENLVSKGYLKSNETNCPNGDLVEISTDGIVSSKKPV